MGVFIVGEDILFNNLTAKGGGGGGEGGITPMDPLLQKWSLYI